MYIFIISFYQLITRDVTSGLLPCKFRASWTMLELEFGSGEGIYIYLILTKVKIFLLRGWVRLK